MLSPALLKHRSRKVPQLDALGRTTSVPYRCGGKGPPIFVINERATVAQKGMRPILVGRAVEEIRVGVLLRGLASLHFLTGLELQLLPQSVVRAIWARFGRRHK